MKIKELIEKLSKINPEKDIRIIVNLENTEDDDYDVFCNGIELWDCGSESMDIFISKWLNNED
jgi:hypothetical protein